MKGKCCICGREVNTVCKVKDVGYMCQKHQHQWYEKGRITDDTPYTLTDKNEFIEYDDYYEIILRKPTEGYREVARCIIDKDDYEKCKDLRWRYSEHNYNKNSDRTIKDVCTGSKTKNNMNSIYRHIMDCPEDKVIDHINGDRLDNRKSNLRICEQKDNVFNRTKMQTSNTSGVTGVYRDNRCRDTNWIAEIKIYNVKIYLAAFIELEDAIYCRLYAEQLLFGKFGSDMNYNNAKKYIGNIDIETKNKIKTKVVDRIKDKFNSINKEIPKLYYEHIHI